MRQLYCLLPPHAYLSMQPIHNNVEKKYLLVVAVTSVSLSLAFEMRNRYWILSIVLTFFREGQQFFWFGAFL